MRKKGIVTGHAFAARAKEGVAAVLKIEKLGFIGELVAERSVEPVGKRAGGVAGVIETGDGGLAKHSVGVYVVVGFVDVVHVRSLFSADIWKADDLCRLQDFFDLIKVDVLILCIYCDGRAELFHERHLAHCGDPLLHFEHVFVVVRDDQLKLRLFLVLQRSRWHPCTDKPYMDKNNARQNRKAQAGDWGSE